MTNEQKEAARRRGNFERHVAECIDCGHNVDGDGMFSPVLCMSGSIMAGHMIKAIQVAAGGHGMSKPRRA